MKVSVNGEAREAPEGATLLALLEALGLVPGRVAVERNGAVVRRGTYDAVRLEEGDRLEIVQLVGGG